MEWLLCPICKSKTRFQLMKLNKYNKKNLFTVLFFDLNNI